VEAKDAKDLESAFDVEFGKSCSMESHERIRKHYERVGVLRMKRLACA
jgi:hypothetical protein